VLAGLAIEEQAPPLSFLLDVGYASWEVKHFVLLQKLAGGDLMPSGQYQVVC
jgi:hypothetical protein